MKLRFIGSRTVHSAIATGDVGFSLYGILTGCGIMRTGRSAAYQEMSDVELVTCKRCKRKVV